MASKSKINQAKKLKKSSRHSSKVYNRCHLCGRPRAYMRKFGVCRICFRELASNNQIPGVSKKSW